MLRLWGRGSSGQYILVYLLCLPKILGHLKGNGYLPEILGHLKGNEYT